MEPHTYQHMTHVTALLAARQTAPPPLPTALVPCQQSSDAAGAVRRDSSTQLLSNPSVNRACLSKSLLPSISPVFLTDGGD